MDKIKLQSLTLVTFNKQKKEHLNFFKRLVTDSSVTKRFGGLLTMLNNSSNDTDNEIFEKGYFIMDGSEYIGYIDISKYRAEEQAVYLRGAIIQEKRNKGYGIKMLEETSEYIFMRYPNQIKEIKLKTVEDNIQALRTIQSCGFKPIYGTLFSKTNPYYTKAKSY